MKRANRSLVLLGALCAVSWPAGSSFLRAERLEVLSEPAYRELRGLSRTLDERAGHANDAAQRRDSWISRHDQDLLRSIADFARSATRFDHRLASYRAAPWQVEDDLQRLVEGAQDARDRVRRSRYADDRTLGDWNEIVEIANRMRKVSRSRDGLVDSAPPPPGRDEYGERHAPPGARGSRELAGLAREFEDRANRAYGLAQRVAAEGPYRREYFQSIRDFHDQAVAFRRGIDNGSSDRAQIRAEAGRLLESAHATDENMRRSKAFRDVWPEWHAAMEVLQQILNLPRG